MGKRELVLIFAFLVIGLVVYQLTAPPPRPGQEGFSLSRLLRRVRTEIQGETSTATTTTGTTHAIDAGVREVIVAGFRGSLVVEGENRSDMAAELKAEAAASEPAEAERRVRQIVPKFLALRDTVRVVIQAPADTRRYRADLTLKVPQQLSLRLDDWRGSVHIQNVADVVLRSRGDAIIQQVAGQVRGEHRDGDLEIAGARGVSLDLRRSTARLERITGLSVVTAIEGRLEARAVSGELRVEGRRVDIEIDPVQAPAHLSNIDGEVQLRRVAAPVQFEGRRGGISIALEKPVGLELNTTDAAIEVLLPAAGGLTLDAVASRGEIRLDDQSIKVAGDEDERRAAGSIAGGGPVLVLRATGGNIIIRK